MRSAWLKRGLVLAAYLALVACSDDGTDVTRRGGPIPSTAGGADSSGGSANGDAVKWCDALAVIKAKCQRCHQDPLQNGAPMPLLTYDDTQATWSSTQAVHDVMLDVVDRGIMPYVTLNDPPNSLMPPVEPLTSTEKATLLGWLKQGALPAGGTACP